MIFLADLARAIHGIDVAIDFIAISRFAPDSGRVRILKDIELDLAGRDVVVVEDMVDTGLTANYLCRQLAERNPRRLDVCTLLDRPVRRIVPLDGAVPWARRSRTSSSSATGCTSPSSTATCDQVYEADRRVVQADPGAYVASLYGTAGDG